MTIINNSLAYSGETLVYNNECELLWPEYMPDPRFLTLNQTVGGVITANKLSGYDGDIVTLSNTATGNYYFDSYSITGAILTGNSFKFNNSNVTAKANFITNLIASGTFANKTFQALVVGSSTHSTGYVTTRRGVSKAITVPGSGYLVATTFRDNSNPEYYSLSRCNEAALNYESGIRSGRVIQMDYVSSVMWRSDTYSSIIYASGPYTFHICDSVADYGWSGNWYYYRNLDDV
jgi:hypothetical protein